MTQLNFIAVTFLTFSIAATTVLAQRPLLQNISRPTRRERIDLYKTSKICSKELNFPRDDANRLIRGYLDRDDEEAQCFVKCVYTKTNVMNEDGDIDEERLKRLLPKAIFAPEKVPQWIETCRDVEAETNCEVAYKTYACFLKQVWPDDESYTKNKDATEDSKGEVINQLALANYGKN